MVNNYHHEPYNYTFLREAYRKVRLAVADVDAGRAPITAVSFWLDPSHRPVWMSDEQWHQFIQWMRGDAIPTDEELYRALLMEGNYRDPSPTSPDRGSYWVYRSVDASFIGKGNVETWSKLIQEFGDADLQMDAGL